MVAAATAFCLDPTNVHRQSSNKSAAFPSLAGAIEKMALNFGVSAAGKLLNSSPPAPTIANNGSMNTLLVSDLHTVPQISPGTAALKKINEVLALSSATSSPFTPNTQQVHSDESSPGSAVNNEASLQLAEKLKEQLTKAIDNVSFFGKFGWGAHAKRSQISDFGALISSLIKLLMNKDVL